MDTRPHMSLNEYGRKTIGDIKEQFGTSMEVGGPACGRGWSFVILEVPSTPGHSVTL